MLIGFSFRYCNVFNGSTDYSYMYRKKSHNKITYFEENIFLNVVSLYLPDKIHLVCVHGYVCVCVYMVLVNE